MFVFTILADYTGLVMGQDGRSFQEVLPTLKAIIKLSRDYGPTSGGKKKGVTCGSEENLKKALQMILNCPKKRFDLHTAKVETVQIPKDKVDLFIGQESKTINAIKAPSRDVNVRIKDCPSGLAFFSLFSLFSPSTHSYTITGSEKDIEKAKQLIDLAAKGGNIVVGATMTALIANLGVKVEESSD